jgi:MSHA biogenesis protein MshK
MRLLLAIGAALAAAAVAAAALPDPTRPPLAAPLAPPAATVPSPGNFRLQSIVFGPGRRLAVINGHQVHEGSAVGEARVLQIQRESVVLEIEGRRQALSLYASAAHAASVAVTRRSAEPGVHNHD